MGWGWAMLIWLAKPQVHEHCVPGTSMRVRFRGRGGVAGAETAATTAKLGGAAMACCGTLNKDGKILRGNITNSVSERMTMLPEGWRKGCGSYTIITPRKGSIMGPGFRPSSC